MLAYWDKIHALHNYMMDFYNQSYILLLEMDAHII